MEQIYKLKNRLCPAYKNLPDYLLAFYDIHGKKKKLLGLYLKHRGVKRQNVDCCTWFTDVTKTQYNTISLLLLLDREHTQEMRHPSKQIKTKIWPQISQGTLKNTHFK